MRVLRRLPPILALLLATAACSACWPDEALRVASPDGSAAAVVVALPSLDPPRQVVKLERGGEETVLLRLGEDSDWVDEVAWTDDGHLVGFLITGRRLAVFDAFTAGRVADLDLLAGRRHDGSFPWAQDLSFGDQRRTVRFRVCRDEPSIRCGGEETTRL